MRGKLGGLEIFFAPPANDNFFLRNLRNFFVAVPTPPVSGLGVQDGSSLRNEDWFPLKFTLAGAGMSLKGVQV